MDEKTPPMIVDQNGGGTDRFSLVLSSIREAMACLSEIDQETVKFTLYKDIINGNPQPLDLVQQYFHNSRLLISESCDALLCLQEAHKLNNFSPSEHQFMEQFFSIFQSALEKQMSMLVELNQRKEKLDKKLRSLKSWRKACKVVFAAAFAAFIGCSVVGTAVAAPVMAALTGAAMAPLGWLSKCNNSMSKKKESKVKMEGDIISLMQTGSRIAIAELESKLEFIWENELSFGEEEGIVLPIEGERKELSEFLETMAEQEFNFATT